MIKQLLTQTKRNTNLITVARAEAMTAGAGWTVGAGITSAAAGSIVGPFGFGVNTLVTSAAAGDASIQVTCGSLPIGGVTISAYVQKGTMNSFRLGIVDTSTSTTADALFTYNSTTGLYELTSNGAVYVFGSVDVLALENGWQRVQVMVWPDGGRLVPADAISAVFTTNVPSKTISVWGVFVEANDFATATIKTNPGVGTYASDTLYTILPADFPAGFKRVPQSAHVVIVDDDGNVADAAPTLRAGDQTVLSSAATTGNLVIGRAASPYLAGLESGRSDIQNGQELPIVRLRNDGGIKVNGAEIEMQCEAGASAIALTLQGRMDDNSPWVTIGTAYDQTAIGLGKVATVDAYPQMRFYITTLATAETKYVSAWING